MKTPKPLKIISTYVACLMLAFALPVSVYAESDSDESQTVQQPVVEEPTQPTAPEPAAPVSPTKPEPAAPKAPEPPTTYEFDSATQKWNSNKWRWDESQNKYVPVTVQQNEVKSTNNGTSSTKANTNTSIANALDSIAKTGDTKVSGNTKGGSAVSGNANVSGNIVNNVNSTMSNANNKEAANFVMDIMGDVNGDIMLEPMLLKAMLESKASESNATDKKIDSTNNTAITNNMNLNANSGKAEVSGNTGAGDATTGSANTVANVMNIVNSMIAANQSFNGTINIYGNLNGDILIAPDFLAQMLANNGIQSSATGATKLNAKDTQQIVNNVSLAAESGAALVGNNTSAGSAQTGDADTNLVIFNMTGHDIVAENSLLVFINVLGQWVGVIVDAPQGATAAALGNNVSKNDIEPSLEINATNDTKITNNINLASKSGDATVTGNTSAGNAKTGNATASANIGNISNSTMGLTGWFGKLFINVFGTWNGSFGVDTAAGNPVQSPSSNSQSDSNTVIKFIPREQRTDRSSFQRLRIVTPSGTTSNGSESFVQEASATNNGEVKGANDTKSDIPSQQSYIDNRKEFNIPLAAVSLIAIIGSGYVLRKFLF